MGGRSRKDEGGKGKDGRCGGEEARITRGKVELDGVGDEVDSLAKKPLWE